MAALTKYYQYVTLKIDRMKNFEVIKLLNVCRKNFLMQENNFEEEQRTSRNSIAGAKRYVRQRRIIESIKKWLKENLQSITRMAIK